MQTLRSQLANLPKGLRTRFAPSPTGYLHLGHVASAIFVWGIARRIGAEIVLRLEDHDQIRSRSEFADSIYEDLDWLGLRPDHGWLDRKSYIQSAHPERYSEARRLLRDRVYACGCSRKEITERSPQSGEELCYDNHCRNLHLSEEGKVGLRVKLQEGSALFPDLLLGPREQNPIMQCGDLLIRDRDKNWTYNFTVVVDDLLEDIDLVIRGQDILHATGRQIQLRSLLSPKAAPLFLHHPLIWESPEKKLSKRDGSTSIASMRARGKKAEDLLGEAALAVGLLPAFRPLPVAELETLFHE